MEMITAKSSTAKRIYLSVTAMAIIAVAVVASITIIDRAQASAGRPFKGDASGIFTGPASGEGEVQATHIGKGTVVFADLVVDQSVPTPDGDAVCFPTTGGDQTFTAANGDELTIVYVSGPFCVNPSTGAPVKGSFVTEITGGTGRFDDAEGQIMIEAVGTATGWASHFTDESWIKY